MFSLCVWFTHALVPVYSQRLLHMSRGHVEAFSDAGMRLGADVDSLYRSRSMW
jgi:hypothetical protein